MPADRFHRFLTEIFISACFAACNVVTYINPRFRFVLRSRDAVAALFLLAQVQFCAGLLDVVQSLSAPPLSWFEGLSSVVPINTWGVYVLILKKAGHDALLYIGSGCATYRGLRVRIHEHKTGVCSPVNVKLALEFGYDITHIALLAHCDIPPPAHIPRIRTLIVALEAVFTALFWAVDPSKGGLGLSHLCPWDQHAFEWLGLATHSPLHEGFQCNEADLDFTAEELEEMARAVKEKNAKYQYDYQRALRANPTEQYKKTQKANRIKQAPATKARQQEAVENQTYRCKVCGVSCRDAATLRRHDSSPRHISRVERGGADTWDCDYCHISFKYESALNAHKLSKTHIANVSGAN